MSFIHSTIVGHFDPETLSPLDQSVSRHIDIEAAKSLHTEFPVHVTSQIEFKDGYVQCWWADGTIGFSQPTHEYAYRLAESQNCVAAESPVYLIEYPEIAKQFQMEAWKRWREQNPSARRIFPSHPTRNVPGPKPCPFCGELLRTGIARQCRHCKMDWHVPENYRLLVDRG